MALKTARLVIDHSLLPQKYDKLGVRFERHSVAKIKANSPNSDMVLIRPAGALLSADEAVGPEPRWNNIICGMGLKTLDGTNIQGGGQLVITGQRFIGMIDIDKGTSPRAPALSTAKSGSIFCFSLHRDDIYPPQVKKHRLMPSDFSFRSREEQPVSFQFLIFAATAYIANDKMGYWLDKDMLRCLSEEGRQALLKS